jgi:hypothetical protein
MGVSAWRLLNCARERRKSCRASCHARAFVQGSGAEGVNWEAFSRDASLPEPAPGRARPRLSRDRPPVVCSAGS